MCFTGHIGLMVPNVDEACARFEKLGVEFVKKPTDGKSPNVLKQSLAKRHNFVLSGKMKGIAFIKDPDGYWIEIFNSKTVAESTP